MKTRFRAFFTPASPRSASWIACLLVGVILVGGILVSCQANPSSSTSSPSPVVNQDEDQWYAFDRIYTLFGRDHDYVWKVLFPDGLPEIEKSGNSEDSTYWLEKPISVNQFDTKIQLGFHNNILMSALYRFDRPEDALTTSRALIDHLSDRLGSAPLAAEFPNRLGSLTEVPDADKFPQEYSEEWELALASDVVAVLLPDLDVTEQVFRLKLALSFLDESTTTIQIRYMAVLNNLQSDHVIH
jgi:hypothetical protein